jgi:hypothetical protein
VSCVKPGRCGLYIVPRLDPEVHEIEDDEQTGPWIAAVGEDFGHPGHRIQLAGTGSPADRDAAVVTRPAHAIERLATSWPATVVTHATITVVDVAVRQYTLMAASAKPDAESVERHARRALKNVLNDLLFTRRPQ